MILRKGTAVKIATGDPYGGNPPYTCGELVKGDGTFVAPSDGVCTDNSGVSFSISLDSTDTDTDGPLAAQIQDNVGNRFVVECGQVVQQPLALVPNDGTAPLNFYSVGFFSSTGYAISLQSGGGAACIEISGDGPGIAIVSNDDSILATQINANTMFINDDGTNYLIRAANALLDLVNGVETGITVRQFFRLVGAVLYGKSFLTGATRRFRNPADTTDRVTATTDNQGQRTAVTLNP